MLPRASSQINPEPALNSLKMLFLYLHLIKTVLPDADVGCDTVLAIVEKDNPRKKRKKVSQGSELS